MLPKEALFSNSNCTILSESVVKFHRTVPYPAACKLLEIPDTTRPSIGVKVPSTKSSLVLVAVEEAPVLTINLKESVSKRSILFNF